MVGLAVVGNQQAPLLDRTKTLASEFGTILQLALNDVVPKGFASCEAKIRKRRRRQWSRPLNLMSTSGQHSHRRKRSEELRENPHSVAF
ncbi:hypothetical protein EV286_11293 [Rhizobium sp. BK251]|nr:hypothetical protein EV286_11293 [Rhizobium sp. BK251]